MTARRLTRKQGEFVAAYAETGIGVTAAMKAYDANYDSPCNKAEVCPRPHPPGRFRCKMRLGLKLRGVRRHIASYQQLMER